MAFGQYLENLWKSSESGRKSSEKRRYQYVNIINKIVASRYGISLLVFNFISYSFAAPTCEISS